MDIMTILLVVVLIAVLLGSFGFQGGAYRVPGIGLGTIILIVIILVILT